MRFLQFLAFLAAAVLAGCANLPVATLSATSVQAASSAAIPVNLPGGKAEAQAMLDALEVIADNAAASMAIDLQGKVSTDLAALSNAVAQFTALPDSATSYATKAQDVISAVRMAAAIIPLPPATSFAITEGTTLLSALVTGLSTITVSPKPAMVASAMPDQVSPPIPIPLQ